MVAPRNRFRFGALVLCLALVAGACGGGGDKTNKVASHKTTATDVSSDSTLDVGADVGADGETTTGVGGVTGAATATTKKGGGSATTAKPGGNANRTADPNAVPGPAKTGTYAYAQSGSTSDGPVPPNGTLVVNGGQTQTYSRYYDPNKSPLVLTYDFRSNGPFITQAVLNGNGTSITCTFGNGVPVPPWPPEPGKTFNGSGTCPSPIGPLTATIAGSVTSRNGDLVGIDATVNAKNTANTVNVTLHEVSSWSISLRVPKTTHETYSGTSPLGPISGDVTSTLTATP